MFLCIMVPVTNNMPHTSDICHFCISCKSTMASSIILSDISICR